MVQNYSKSQREIWRRIPLLCLNADGITGYSDGFEVAYRWGFWQVQTYCNVIGGGDYRVFVDLATGELIDAGVACGEYCKEEIIPAHDEDVINLAFRIEKLDAKEIVNSLEKKIKTGKYRDTKTEDDVKKWRSKLKKKLRLKEVYKR